MLRYLGIVLCLAIALPALGQVAPEQPWPPIPDEEEHSILFRSRAGFEPPADWFKPRLTPLHWDVLHYDISLDVNVAGREIEGTVVATIESLEDGLETIVLDLYDNMEVHWVRTDGIDLDFSRGGNQLQITLARERSTGEEFDVEIRYGGSPTVTGLGSFRFRTHASGPIVSSLSEPEGARTWWPCRDVPYDKTTMSMHLTVPDPLVGVSNGTLVGIDSADNKLTYHWVEEYPIATYLVSVAVSNYVSWSETYTPPSGPTMEVWYWVYPHHEAEAREDFNVTVPMMEFYSELFGEYPFLSEKYGMAEFPCWCAMEHQTASSYGDNFVRGDHRYDWIVAHELAHQWWGDLVTLGTWKDMWLNEGFTTYSEPLWFSRNDPPRYRAYMNGLDGGPFEGTVYDPDELFGRTVYHKGAWVLHMLRHVIGDAPFFELLRDWAESYAYQSPETWQLQELAETYYEDPQDPRLGLGWFFDEWVYGPGRPDYRWGWLASQWEGSWSVHVRVEQAQGFDTFRMPLDVRIDHPSGPTTHVAWNDTRVQDYIFSMDEGPVDLDLDPDDWVLKHSREIYLPDPDGDGIPDWADGCPDSWNPGQEDSDGDTIQDACDPAEDSDGDTVTNDRDCADGDPLVWELPGEATGLRFEGGREGVMVWDTYDPINAQEISYDAIRGDLADLLALGTTEQAHCLFRAAQWPEQVDRDTPGGAGRILYYLVRARNSCGGGPWGPESHERIRLNQACQ